MRYHNTMKIRLPMLKCLRCLGQWVPRIESPRRCPHCKSPYWNKPRKG